MPRSRRLGSDAEDRAAAHLQAIGYTVVARNVVFPKYSEIDIVCMDGDTVVFVEVKARKSGSIVGPEESIRRDKAARLWASAERYLAEYVGKESEARFDVVAIDGDDLRHHVDAFRM